MYAVCSWSVTPQANPLYNLADKSREAGAVSPALALFSSHITSGCGPALRWLLAASDYQSTCRVAACLVLCFVPTPVYCKHGGSGDYKHPPTLRVAEPGKVIIKSSGKDLHPRATLCIVIGRRKEQHRKATP